MYVAFFVVLLTLSLMLVPLKFRLMGYINLVNANVGYYAVRFFGHPVHFGRFKLHNSHLYVTLKNSKTKRLTGTITDKDSVSVVSYLDNAFFLVADIRTFDYFVKVGNRSDAYLTATVTAALKIAASTLDEMAHRRYPKLASVNGIDADFTDDIVQASFSSIFYMTLTEILYGILYAIRRTLRYNRRMKKTGKTKRILELG